MPEENKAQQPEQKSVEENTKASKTSIADTLERYKSAVDDLQEQLAERPTREEYDAVDKLNKELLEQRINGLPAEEADGQVVRNRKELIEAINNPNTNNLEYVKACQELHDLTIKEGKPDPYAAAGKTPSDEDSREAEKVYRVFNEWLEEAGDNPEVFNNIVTRELGDGAFRRR